MMALTAAQVPEEKKPNFSTTLTAKLVITFLCSQCSGI
jgi:hypothetical protein